MSNVDTPAAPERVFIGLGTNLGTDLERNLREAISAIGNLPRTQVVRASSFLTSEPWGVADQPRFLNAVVEIRTGLEPLELLRALKNLESQLGRVPSYRWGPRSIDFDIILYGQRVVNEPGLEIPHPRFKERDFVLRPLREIAPEVLAPFPPSTEDRHSHG
jgi:2-amino-4-hydroxy-6-hydroxymethyldihydropteridine diphosphokinase